MKTAGLTIGFLAFLFLLGIVTGVIELSYLRVVDEEVLMGPVEVSRDR